MLASLACSRTRLFGVLTCFLHVHACVTANIRVDEDVFKTSSRRLAKMSSIRLQDLFNTFLRRTAKTIIYRQICLGHTSEKFMVRVQIFQG